MPPSAPAGYPRTPNVRRCSPREKPGKTSSSVPLTPPAENLVGLRSSVMPTAPRNASTWCAKPGRSSDLYAVETPTTLRVAAPLVPDCQRCLPLTLTVTPSSGEVLRVGRRAFDHPADASRAG